MVGKPVKKELELVSVKTKLRAMLGKVNLGLRERKEADCLKPVQRAFKPLL